MKTSILDASEAFPINGDQDPTTEDVTVHTGDSEMYEDAVGSPNAKKELLISEKPSSGIKARPY